MNIINRVDPSYIHLGKKYDSDTTVVVDISIIIDDRYKNSVAFLNEPNSVLSHYVSGRFNPFQIIAEKLKTGNHSFSKLYTCFKCFEGYPNTHILEHTPLPSWISSDETSIHPKTKDLCFITSSKSFTPLQTERVNFANWIQQNKGVTVYGRGYTPVERKATVLIPSRFCVVIENERLDGWHTEKVIDCFATGTIPLYVGDNDITKIYDSAGIFVFESVDDLRSSDILKNLFEGKGKEIYESKLNSVVANYNKYLSVEQYRTGEYVFGMINDDWKNMNDKDNRR